jgi:hypothetical protein
MQEIAIKTGSSEYQSEAAYTEIYTEVAHDKN